MRATAAPEEGNRVRLSVEVDEAEIDKALDEVMRRLSREVRVPGFRPGKVPRRVIEARMGGAEAVRSEALREALPDFYTLAVTDTELDPIAPPTIDITGGEESGPVTFDAVVEVRPLVGIAGYQGLQVTLPGVEVPEDEVQSQIDRLRATSGELVEVDRPARAGDQVTIDIHGSSVDDGASDEGTVPALSDDALRAEDFLYEVGSGGVVPELDEELVGVTVGDEVTFESTLEAIDRTVTFRVQVKEVKELVLPEVTDEWVAEASEFETVEELTDDIATRLRQLRVVQAQMALQERALDALVELVTEDVPEVLVAEELSERIHDLNHRLEHQKISLAQFLALSGREEQDLLDELQASALRGVKADLALRALVEAEQIEVTEEELDAEFAAMSERLDMDAEQVREQLDRAGRLPAVRSDQRKAKALRWLLDNVELVDEEGNPISRDDLRSDQGEEDSE
jgi:trigger factor